MSDLSPVDALPDRKPGPREVAAARAIAGIEQPGAEPGPQHYAAARAALDAADRIAPPSAPSERHMDAVEAGAVIENLIMRTVERVPPHPSRHIESFSHVDGDGSTTLFWYRNHLAAVGVVARDVSNWSVAATWENPDLPQGTPGSRSPDDQPLD